MKVIIVEGKSDTNKLKSIWPSIKTIETGGSALTKEKLELMKKANELHGVIIFTDPDGPGKKIRQQIIDYVGNCEHAFVDKSKAIGKGKVGIAETSKEDIILALENVWEFNDTNQTVSMADLISAGYVGKSDSKEKRIALCKKLNISYANAKTLHRWLNMIGITKEEI